MLVNKQGLKLAAYWWPAHTKAKGIVHIIHGHGAHLQNEFLARQGAGKPTIYKGSWVEAWNKTGFSVCGIDQQGLGFSEGVRGLRCFVLDFDDYIDDAVQFRRHLRSSNAPNFEAELPCFVAGCSLGGCIAVSAIHRHPKLYQGAILMAPMLSLIRLSSQGINRYLRPIADLVSFLFPTWPIVQTSKNTMYPELQAEWDEDPLCWHGKTRARNAAEYLRATERCVAEMDTFTFPYLNFHSENDTLCDPDGSKLLYARSKTKDKTFKAVNHMWHVLVKEKNNEELLHLSIQWMEGRLSVTKN